MKVDAGTYQPSIDAAGAAAVEAERDGYDGWWAFETQADPFLACAIAAERTERIGIGTSIVVAFARNPMTVALQANDVQALSGGRFVLGLGSQIKAHITRRYSMPWSKPAARMREFVLAIRAIWETWASDAPLQFEGEFYSHTLMAPFFNPGPNPHGKPKVFLAAVGTHMIRTAAEVCDGLLAHGFSTVAYARDVIVPTIEAGLDATGRSRSDFQLSQPVFVVTGADEAEMAASRAAVKQQIAFYGSTPAYRGVLEHHGWGGLQDELNAMSKRGEWREMANVIDDAVLDAFAVVGEPYEAGAGIRERYGDIADRVSFYTKPDGHGPEVMTEMMRGLRG
jgi:probable F420-dependent oxidoreductase